MHQIIKLKGEVIHGEKRGRKFGFPTANILVDNIYSHLENGVYIAKINWQGNYYNGVANIGTHPTVGALSSRQLEVHIFDFCEDIYNQTIEVTLTQFLRTEKQFSSIEELLQEINNDINNTKRILNNEETSEK